MKCYVKSALPTWKTDKSGARGVGRVKKLICVMHSLFICSIFTTQCVFCVLWKHSAWKSICCEKSVCIWMIIHLLLICFKKSFVYTCKLYFARLHNVNSIMFLYIYIIYDFTSVHCWVFHHIQTLSTQIRIRSEFLLTSKFQFQLFRIFSDFPKIGKQSYTKKWVRTVYVENYVSHQEENDEN